MPFRDVCYSGVDHTNAKQRLKLDLPHGIMNSKSRLEASEVYLQRTERHFQKFSRNS